MAFLVMAACRQVAAFVPASRQLVVSTSRALLMPCIRSPPIRMKQILSMSTITDMDALNQRIVDKGDEIRQLKATGMSKEDLLPHINELKALKSQLPSDEPPAPPASKKLATTPKAPVVEKEMDESELRQNRLDKVAAMKAAGVEPYEYTYRPTITAAQLAAEYNDKLEPGEEDVNTDVAVAGRIMTRRVFGKLAFFSLQDETGIVQLQMDKARLGDSFEVSKK